LVGTYQTSAGTFSNFGKLTFDAKGNPNAVFIFQAASTVITSTASSMALNNGAQACNVFWRVGSSATLGVNSTASATTVAIRTTTTTAARTTTAPEDVLPSTGKNSGALLAIALGLIGFAAVEAVALGRKNG
jgi:LPXTG-motif cell wall-anchored protein